MKASCIMQNDRCLFGYYAGLYRQYKGTPGFIKKWTSCFENKYVTKKDSLGDKKSLVIEISLTSYGIEIFKREYVKY